MSLEMETMKKVNAVKFEMMLSHNRERCGFFSALLSMLKIIITDDIRLASTNGSYIKLNPNFVKSIDSEHLMFVLMHELGHVLYEHVIYAVTHNLDLRVHNIAGDYYINLWLNDVGFKYASCGNYYFDEKYRGWTTMQIYNDLMKDPPPPSPKDMHDLEPASSDGDASGNGNGSCGANNGAIQKVRANIIKAATIAKMTGGWGSVPADIKLAIEKVTANKLPWNSILAKYMNAYAKDDYSMRKPNRRYMPHGLYMPSLYNPALGGVFLGMDVSGSMCEKTLNYTFAEANHFWETHKPEWLRLMTFDTRVIDDKKFFPGDSLEKFTYNGGGGTHVRPLLEAIREEKPRFAIILTDGDFPAPKVDDVPCDIIWGIIDKPSWKASRARDKVIHIESENR